MNRRLKNRVPPAIFSGMREGSHIVLFIVASVFISPDAFAQIASQKVEPVFTKTYTKEELAKGAPANPSKDLSGVLGDHFSALFARVTANQSGKNVKLLEFSDQSSVPSERAYAMKLAALRGDTTNASVNSDAMRQFLRGQTEKAFGDRVKDSSQLYRSLKEGLAFNLNFGKLFGKKSAAAPTDGTVKYGLVLKDIVPTDKGHLKAALSDPSNEDMRYAGHAEVHWTIGPLDEEQKRKLFNFSEGETLTKEETSLWSRVKLPSANFGGKIEPSSADDAAAANPAVSSQGLGSGVKITMTQEDSLYQMVLVTDKKLKKETLSNEFRIPLVGAMAVGRRFDDKFNVLQTSVLNVLVDKSAPRVNLHYLHKEDRYKAEAGVERANQTVGVEANMRPGFKPGKDALGEKGEEYKLNYTKLF